MAQIFCFAPAIMPLIEPVVSRRRQPPSAAAGPWAANHGVMSGQGGQEGKTNCSGRRRKGMIWGAWQERRSGATLLRARPKESAPARPSPPDTKKGRLRETAPHLAHQGICSGSGVFAMGVYRIPPDARGSLLVGGGAPCSKASSCRGAAAAGGGLRRRFCRCARARRWRDARPARAAVRSGGRPAAAVGTAPRFALGFEHGEAVFIFGDHLAERGIVIGGDGFVFKARRPGGRRRPRFVRARCSSWARESSRAGRAVDEPLSVVPAAAGSRR